MKFLEVISDWVNEHFSNQEAIFLVALIAGLLIVLAFLGGYLAPVLTGLIFAFVLQGLVKKLEQHMPRLLAVYLTFVLFISTLLALALMVFPLLWQQLSGFLGAAPQVVVRLRDVVADLSARFPDYVTQDQISALIDQSARELGNLSATVVETAFSQVFSILGLIIYLVLVPISVFFFLKDKDLLLEFVRSLLPQKSPLLKSVGEEMNEQLGNYVRGKVIEILIVGSVTFVTFTYFELNYAALLAVLVGISVLIPFVGAAVVTIPVFVVAVLQFGWTWELGWIMAAYGIIQFFDGNLLVPLLFSEVVDLHPITIIVAVLAFGGIWGVWGVFFAIPLATLIKAIYKAWPQALRDNPDLDQSSPTSPIL